VRGSPDPGVGAWVHEEYPDLEGELPPATDAAGEPLPGAAWESLGRRLERDLRAIPPEQPGPDDDPRSRCPPPAFTPDTTRGSPGEPRAR